MADDTFERALAQLSKALTVGYSVAVKLRKEAADAEQHAILIEQVTAATAPSRYSIVVWNICC
jgi:hypothetical protein